MKVKLFFTSLMMVIFAFACQEDPIDPIDSNTDSQLKCETVYEGSIESIVLESPSLEGNVLHLSGERNVNVYLPKDYYKCPQKRFPVIYFLHGMPCWENMLIDPAPFDILSASPLLGPPDFPPEGFISWVNNLIDNEGLREVIIVMPDARTIYGPSFYLNSEVHGNFDDYIAQDLVTYIDNNFRTISHFNWRAITGHCAGGYGALNIAMRHPHTFGLVGALSPAHFTEDHINQMSYMGLQEDMMWLQQGIPEGPTMYDPIQPFKFVNNTIYSFCEFWLPNLENPPFYCDLPYSFEDGQLVIDPVLMDKINSQNLLAQTKEFSTGLKQLKGIYFDCGTEDPLGMYSPNVMLDEQLTQLHIKHEFETFAGGHFSNIYERLAILWTKVSNDFPEKDN